MTCATWFTARSPAWLRGAWSVWRRRRFTPWPPARCGRRRWRGCGRCGGRSSARPLTLLLKGPEEVTDWVPRISQVGRRMAWRLWPGPATLVFSRSTSDGLYSRLSEQVKSLVSPNGAVALRCPAQPIVRDVLRLLPAPLVIATVATPENPVPATRRCPARPARRRHGDRRRSDALPEARDGGQDRRGPVEHRTRGGDRRRDPGRELRA